MRIESSQIRMSARHSSSVADQRDTSLELVAESTSQQALLSSASDGSRKSFETTSTDSIRLSREAMMASESRESSRVSGQSTITTPEMEYSLSDEQVSAAESIISGVIDREVRVSRATRAEPDSSLPGSLPVFNGAGSAEAMKSSSLEMTLHSRETHYEAQGVQVNASGMVKTEDGREIDFSLQLEMDREFFSAVEETTSLTVEHRVERKERVIRKLVDPLVINFEGKAPELTDMKFKFDLNSDGLEDNISFLESGSGFLAFDSNADGVINNGRELFGARTGDGFRELAEYDEDNNQWIDENDAIYEKLAVWTKDASGRDELRNLKELNVGAIYLGNVDSRFDFKDDENNLDGQLRRSGVYLDENGAVKTIQQIDLAIEPDIEEEPEERVRLKDLPGKLSVSSSIDSEKMRKLARLGSRGAAAAKNMEQALENMRRQNETHRRVRQERESRKNLAENAARNAAGNLGKNPVLEMLSRVFGE